jgi:hypothetical protein
MEKLSIRTLPPAKKTFVPLDAATPWKARTWYRARISTTSTNPIFDAIVFSGFLNRGVPAGYSGFTPANYIDSVHSKNISQLHYLELTAELFTDGDPLP